jgi:hypothetical protein
VGRLSRPLQERIDIFGRAEGTRRANQLGTDLVSGSHSLVLGVPDDFFAADFEAVPAVDSRGFGSVLGFDSADGFGSLDFDSLFPLAVSELPVAASAFPTTAGGVCGFLPSLP